MKPYAQDAKEILEKAAALQKQKAKTRCSLLVAAVAVILVGAAAAVIFTRQPAVSVAPESEQATAPTHSGDHEETAAAIGDEAAEEAKRPLGKETTVPNANSDVAVSTSSSEATTVTGSTQPALVWPFGTTNARGETTPSTTVAVPDGGNTSTTLQTTQGVTRFGGNEASGGETDNLPITIERLQTELGVGRRNETLDAATADRYIAENKASIVEGLSMSGVPMSGNVTISDKGYTHLNLSGGGTWKELATDFRDYLIYNDDRLVAILTLWIENGVVHASPAFGGPWFNSFDQFLQQHKGEALAFVYVGMQEYVVTPRGEIINPLGLDARERFPDSGNYYTYLAYPENTYTP